MAGWDWIVLIVAATLFLTMHEYGVVRACEQGTADLACLAALDEEVEG